MTHIVTVALLAILTLSPTVLAGQDPVDIQRLHDRFKQRREALTDVPREERRAALEALATEVFSVVEFETLELDGIAAALSGYTLQYGPEAWMETMLKRLVEIARDEGVTEFERAVASALGASLRMPGTLPFGPAGPEWVTVLQERMQADFRASPERFAVIRGAHPAVGFQKAFAVMITPKGRVPIPASAITELAEAIGEDYPVESVNEIRDLWDAVTELSSRVMDPLDADGRERARQFCLDWSKASEVHFRAQDAPDPRLMEHLETLVRRFDGAAARGRLIGFPAPELSIRWCSDDGITSLADLRGKVVVLDFFATWCGPCIASIPHLRTLRERYSEDDLAIVMITSPQGAVHGVDSAPIDCTDDVEKEIELMPRFMERHGITWAVAMMGGDDTVRHPDFGIDGIPHVAIIDAEGVVRFNGLHPMRDGKVDAIEGLLGEAGRVVPRTEEK